MSFTNVNGGFVNTIVAAAGTRVSTGAAQALGSSVAFGLNNEIAGEVFNGSGILLDSGANYLVSQVSSLVPSSVDLGIASAITDQVASVGLKTVSDFTDQTVGSVFTPAGVSGIGGPNGVQDKGTISVPMSYVETLPNADYGGSSYNLSPDVVFTIVPANAGPQLAETPQSSPTTDWKVGFDSNFIGKTPGISKLKGDAFLAGPGEGRFAGGLAGVPNLNYSSPVTRIPSGQTFIASYW
jgi:hypothetical protein